MNSIHISETLLQRAAHDKERILLTGDDGRPIAALVPLEDAALLESLEERDDLEDFRQAKQEALQEGTLTIDEVLENYGLARETLCAGS